MRAVRFEEWGDRSVLHVAEVPVPEVAPGRVLVKVRAAGINPGESAIRQGLVDDHDPAKLPSGQGTDLAGTVAAIGLDVDGFEEGDEVLGWSWERSSHAEYVSVPAGQLVPKPRLLSWEAAGGLDVVATTGAAGGVGGFVTQLLTNEGIDVIAIASESNHEWLRSKNARPVAYGDGLEDRIRELATNGIDALIDTYGPEYVHLGVTLGIPTDRIETVIAFEAAAELGAKASGSADTADPEILSALANMVADGSVEVPIAATFPLEGVQDAYAQLEERHTRGKIVLVP
jgi:NADPH:quinone reductase-like Zn-dependent oxidoreductase